MCICINCYHVNNCSTYYSIEKQHKKSHLNIDPFFVPQSPVVNVNIINQHLDIALDWDVVECLSFVEAPGKWILYQTNQII
nr:Ycf34 [Erythrocladia irregularis]